MPPQDGLFGIALAGVPAGVHVDRDQSLGGLDDQIPAAGQLDPWLKEIANLGFDLESVEEGRGLVVVVHPLDQLGIDEFEVLADFVMQFSRVDPQGVNLGGEDVAHQAARQRRLAMEERRTAASECLLPLDLLPGVDKGQDLAPKMVLRHTFRDGANDHAAGVVRHKLGHHFTELRSLLAVLDFSRDANLGGVRHVDEKAPCQRDLRRDAATFGRDRLLGDLNREHLALLESLGDVGNRAAATDFAPPAVTVPLGRNRGGLTGFGAFYVQLDLILVAVLVLRVVVILGLEQVRGMEIGTFLESDVNERRLDTAEYGVYPTVVDIADRATLVRAIYQQFDETVVLENGNTGFAGGA